MNNHRRIGSMALPRVNKNGRTGVAASPATTNVVPPAQRKSKVVPYKELRDLYYFKMDGRVFLKMGNSHAIDQRTGKDAILHLNDKVVPLYKAAADLVF
jgi:hypothetical protein